MTDIDDAKSFVLWMRDNGIAWTSLAVGDVTIVGTDTRMPQPEPAKAAPQPEPRRKSIREQYGPPVTEAKVRGLYIVPPAGQFNTQVIKAAAAASQQFHFVRWHERRIPIAS